MTYQSNIFILQEYTILQQYKAIKSTRTRHSLLHTAKGDAIYTTFNTQSGPVHLSCPPECRQLLLLLIDEQPVRTSKGFSRVIYYTWAAAGLRAVVKYF
jgi:hypothetical protein